MQQPVSGIHIAHGLMLVRSLDFELGRGLYCKSCNDVIRSFWKKGLLMGQRMKGQKLGVWFGSQPGFAIEEGLEPQVKNFSIPSKLGDVASKLGQLKHVTEGLGGGAPSRWAIFCNFLEKMAILMRFGSHFARFQSHSKEKIFDV